MRRLTTLIGCLIAFAAMPAASYGQASAAQYGGVEQEVDSGATPTPGAPPAQDTEDETGAGGSPTPDSSRAPEQDAAAAPESAEGTLPFTGQDLVLMLLAGLGLAGLGVTLRRAARSPAA